MGDDDGLRLEDLARRDKELMVIAALLLRKQRNERFLDRLGAGTGLELRGDPVANTLPSFMAASQSNRSASSIYAVATTTLIPWRRARIRSISSQN